MKKSNVTTIDQISYNAKEKKHLLYLTFNKVQQIISITAIEAHELIFPSDSYIRMDNSTNILYYIFN